MKASVPKVVTTGTKSYPKILLATPTDGNNEFLLFFSARKPQLTNVYKIIYNNLCFINIE